MRLVFACVRVQCKQRQEVNRRLHQKHQNTKSVCLCVCLPCFVCHFDDWGNLNQHLTPACVCACVVCVCARLHKHGVRVMRCSLHPSVPLAFLSSEGYNGGEREKEGDGEIVKWRDFLITQVLSVSQQSSNTRSGHSWNSEAPFSCDLVWELLGYVQAKLPSVFLWMWLSYECVFVPLWTCVCVWETERERFHCSVPPYLASRQRAHAAFPPSAMWPGCDTTSPPHCR